MDKKELELLDKMEKQLSKLLAATCSGGVGMAYDRESAYRLVAICNKIKNKE